MPFYIDFSIYECSLNDKDNYVISTILVIYCYNGNILRTEIDVNYVGDKAIIVTP